MIFIKDKKAWKEFVKTVSDDDFVGKPEEYPCYVEMLRANSGHDYDFASYLYKRDLQSMIDNIDAWVNG